MEENLLKENIMHLKGQPVALGQWWYSAPWRIFKVRLLRAAWRRKSAQERKSAHYRKYHSTNAKYMYTPISTFCTCLILHKLFGQHEIAERQAKLPINCFSIKYMFFPIQLYHLPGDWTRAPGIQRPCSSLNKHVETTWHNSRDELRQYYMLLSKETMSSWLLVTALYTLPA